MLQVKIVTTIKKSSLWPSTGTSFCISIIFQKYNTDRNCTTSTSTIYISSTFSMNISGQCRTFTLWYSRNFTCIKDSNTTSVTELKLDNLYIIHCQLKNNLRHNKKKKKRKLWGCERSDANAHLQRSPRHTYWFVCIHKYRHKSEFLIRVWVVPSGDLWVLPPASQWEFDPTRSPIWLFFHWTAFMLDAHTYNMLHKYKHAVVNTNENFLLNSYINSDSDKVGVLST